MRYISWIQRADGVVCRGLLHPEKVPTVRCNIDGIEVSVPFEELDESYLGFSRSGGCALVALDTKTVLLHKYVESAVTSREPCAVLSSGWSVGSQVHCGKETISIDTQSDSVFCYGARGSVAWCNVLTVDGGCLYDILGIYCREYAVNLMKYRTIQFYSRMVGYSTVIKLEQSAEAKRLYAKMYFDVMRGRPHK